MQTHNNTISDKKFLQFNAKFLSGNIKSHIKRCGGCPICLPYRNLINSRIKNDEIEEVSKETGVTPEQILRIRASNREDPKISDYVKNVTNFFDVNGNIDVDKYLLLRFFCFKDEEIRIHFGIKRGPWVKFKKKHFPNYSNTKEYKEYFGPLCTKAYKKWYNSSENRIVKMKP